MMNDLVTRIAVALGLCAALAVPFAGSAVAEGPFDGTKNMVCTANRAYECTPAGGCEQVDVSAVDVSDFFLLNMKKKEISAIYPPDDEVSPIEHVEAEHGTTLVQGSESGRGWGIAIDQQTGRFSASVYGRAVGFVLHGACMPK